MSAAPLIVLAAGGTGGHVFPAEALARSAAGARLPARPRHRQPRRRLWRRRSARSRRIACRWRACRAASCSPRAQRRVDSAPACSRRAALLRRLKPERRRRLRRLSLAADGLCRHPARHSDGVIHEQNAVLGRANRLLARRVAAIATSFPSVEFLRRRAERARQPSPAIRCGPASARCAIAPYTPPGRGRAVPASWSPAAARAPASSARSCRRRVALLPPHAARRAWRSRSRRAPRISSRAHRLRGAGHRAPSLQPFFADVPARLARCASGDLPLGRLDRRGARDGRPPGDAGPLPPRHRRPPDRQRPGAGDAGGGWVIANAEFNADDAGRASVGLLRRSGTAEPRRRRRATSAGRPDAAERLADLVQRLAPPRKATAGTARLQEAAA